MTDKAVRISITIYTGSKAEVKEKDLLMQELEHMISSLGQEMSGREWSARALLEMINYTVNLYGL